MILQKEIQKMPAKTDFDIDIALYALNYATRLLVSELDPEKLVRQIIETVADFSESSEISLFNYDENDTSFSLQTAYSKGQLVESEHEFKLTPEIKKCFASKNPAWYDLQLIDNIPFPAAGPIKNQKCLCFPLVGQDNQVMGLLVLAYGLEKQFLENEMQILRVIVSLCSTCLEKTRLFKQATIDGLTELYTRRYFDVILQKEMNRLKYREGELCFLMTDIDHFKDFNDTYGHQQGDTVLKELASLCINYKKDEVERIPCRYGGEEFALIFPSLPKAKILEFVEELRQTCEKHAFSGQKKSLQVTFSGGLASITSKDNLNLGQFIKRADDMLYKAKEAGRNRIYDYATNSIKK